MGSARRPAVGLAGLFSVLVLLALPVPVLSGESAPGIATSRHDFGSTGDQPGFSNGLLEPGALGGSCSACHLPHYAKDSSAIWTRTLTDERNTFTQSDDPAYRTTSAEYAPWRTMLCYDCHNGDVPNNIPGGWTTSPNDLSPQNTAFDAPTETGYYEMADGTLPSGSYDPPNSPTVPASDYPPTGGHFWRHEPDGEMKIGDKIPCTLCHDPHDKASWDGMSSNQVMLRVYVRSTAGGGTEKLGPGLKASPAARSWTGNATDTGRAMCAACHAYSDAGIPLTLWGVPLPDLTAYNFVEHRSGDATPCTDCHKHNYIVASCTECHGYPPPQADPGYLPPSAENIDETKGPHPRHGNEVALGGYGQVCDTCHYNVAAHPNGQFEDVYFDPARNPAASLPNYDRITDSCKNLYCHSRGTGISGTEMRDGAGALVSVKWDDVPDYSTTDIGCDSCHGLGIDRNEGGDRYESVAFGAPEYPNDGTVKANSHARHRYNCNVCHYTVIGNDDSAAGGWTIANVGLHVSNTSTSFTYDVVADTRAPKFGVYDYSAVAEGGRTATLGGTCTNVVCHGSGATYTRAQWGASYGCLDCHGTDGDDVDNWNVSDGTPSQISRTQWTGLASTGHGRTSGTYPWPTPPTNTAANLGCVSTNPATPAGGCHVSSVPHQTNGNPFRLATPDVGVLFEWPDNSTGPDSMNLFCQTCHPATTDKTHSLAITGSWGILPQDWGDPAAAPTHFKCTDCHDPHGDAPDFMVHARVFADSSDDYGRPYAIAGDGNSPNVTDGLGIQPPTGSAIVFDVPSAGPRTQANYVNQTGGSTTRICQVCHQSNDYFRRNAGTATHYPSVQCIQCHKHLGGFAPDGNNGADSCSTAAGFGCHQRPKASGGDADNWVYNDRVMSSIDADDAAATGHGLTSGTYPWPAPNTAANLGCVSSDQATPTGGCHVVNAHGAATNPFQLATKNASVLVFEWPDGTGNLGPDSVNLFCRNCHGTMTDNNTHSQAITGSWGSTDDWGNPVTAPVHYKCTDCHDPHGDAPDFMVHARVFADSSGNYGLPSTGDQGILPTGASVIDFDVDPVAGRDQADYVNLSAASTTKICQVCHQTNEVFTNAAAPVSHYPGTQCLECHKHVVGFAPIGGCESCHGEVVEGVVSVHRGCDNIANTADDAPNVMSANASGVLCLNGATGCDCVYHGIWWDTRQGGGTNQQGGHGDPDGKIEVKCTECHDVTIPKLGTPPVPTHFDCAVNSAERGTVLNVNTAHLKDHSRNANDEARDFLADTGSGYEVQRQFDLTCGGVKSPRTDASCHTTRTVSFMSHERDNDPAEGVVLLGSHLTVADGEALPNQAYPYTASPGYPTDSDLSDTASTANPDYAPCVACHNPHGTPVTDVKGAASIRSNYMLRNDWYSRSTLCKVCHL